MWSFITFSLLFILPVESQQLCVGNCSLAAEGDKVRDPTNCLRYYYCSDPEGTGNMVASQEPISCMDGYYFNSGTGECAPIDPSTDYCSGLCSPCTVTCKDPGTLLPYPEDCSFFQVCLEEGFILSECTGSTLYFDYLLGECTNDITGCYDVCDPCEVYCAGPGRVPDPYRCDGYYLCDPPFKSFFACPEGHAFNSITQLCEPVADPCTSTCGVTSPPPPSSPSY